LFTFGTGKGFTDQFLEKCDYLLEPIQGFSSFNHLSVRSAIAIALDRWLGINVNRA
jgi:tRNA (guanine37-N1)-methyltransferase